MKSLSITLNTSILTYVQSYWQQIMDDYRTLIGVEAERNNVKRTSLDKVKKVYINPVSTLTIGEYY